MDQIHSIPPNQLEFMHKSAEARQIHSYILYSCFSYSFISFHLSRGTYCLINDPGIKTLFAKHGPFYYCHLHHSSAGGGQTIIP